MNQHLQNILTMIQEDENLSAGQKAAISKSLKDADKELEITAFKLDRTEKVKRTTAILLEETIAELEQKRKAVEAQNRNLEIEAALERVRSRSLAMHKSDEIKDVVKTVVEKMNELNIEMNGGVSLVTFLPESKDLLHWLWIPEQLEDVFKAYLPYFDHIIFKDCNEAREQGTELIAKVYSGEEKQSYFNHLFHQTDFSAGPEEVKEWVMQQPFFGFSFAIQKHSGIFLNDYTGKYFSKETNDILNRFSKVFEQAYVRFLDLQKAEAQARESQIQLALERVRARTMAMQKSDELAEVANLLFQQVQALGLPLLSSGYNIWEKEEKVCTAWMSDQGGSILPSFKIPLTESPMVIHFYNSHQSGESFYAEEVSGEALAAHYSYMLTLPVFDKIIDGFLKAGFTLPTFQVNNVANFLQGNLIFITYKPVPEAHDIFKRFGKVFEQTYTRFLDLQKAEAQARDAQIETSLERIRSRSMGMQKSEELKEIIQVVYEQFVHLNILGEHAGFIMDYKERDDMNIWLADKHEVPFQVTIPYFDSPHWNSFNEAKATGKDFFANNLNFEEKNKFYKELFKLFPVPDEAKEYYFTHLTQHNISKIIMLLWVLLSF